MEAIWYPPYATRSSRLLTLSRFASAAVTIQSREALRYAAERRSSPRSGKPARTFSLAAQLSPGYMPCYASATPLILPWGRLIAQPACGSLASDADTASNGAVHLRIRQR